MFFVKRQTSLISLLLGTWSPHQSRRLSFTKLRDSKETLVLEKVRGLWLLTFSLFIYWNSYRIIQWKPRRRLLLQCRHVHGGLEGNNKQAAATLRNLLASCCLFFEEILQSCDAVKCLFFCVSTCNILNLGVEIILHCWTFLESHLLFVASEVVMQQKQRRHMGGVQSTLSVRRPDWCEDFSSRHQVILQIHTLMLF